MAKRKNFCLLLLCLWAIAPPLDCYAQFWKRKNHGRHQTIHTKSDSSSVKGATWHEETSRKARRRQRKEKEKALRKEKRLEKKQVKQIKPSRRKEESQRIRPRVRVTKKHTVVYPPSVKKPRYRIDVVASVYLDEITKVHGPHGIMKIPEKAIAGLGFYQGVRIAADSLRKSKLPVEIVVHDIENRHEKPDSLMAKGSLDSADLIIGAVMPQEIARFANYCQKRKINFISTISPTDGGVKSDKYFTIVQPTLRTHCTYLTNFLADHFKGKKILWLYRNSNTPEENAFNYFREDSTALPKMKKLCCNHLPNRAELQPLIDTITTQPVLVSVLDILYADSLLKVLSRTFPGAHLEIIGMPSWTGLNLMKRSSYYPNMKFDVPAPFDIANGAQAVKNMDRLYRDLFSGAPDEFVYRGYETLIWYSHLLVAFGTVFNDHYGDIANAPFTRYDIQPSFDKKGQLLYQENRNVYLLRFENGILRP